METTTFNPESASWNQTRSTEQLRSFVTSKLVSLTDVEL
jgi:hypothetical protein